MGIENKIAVLFNPGARQGKALKKKGYLERCLSESGIRYDLFESRSEVDLKNLALTLPGNYSRLAAAGGDTTFFLVVNELRRHGITIPLALIGLGSCNDVARQFGIVSLAEACKRIKENRIQSIDLAVVETEGKILSYFLGQANIGLGVLLNHRVEETKNSWFGRNQVLAGLTAVRKVFRSSRLPLPLLVEWQEGKIERESLMAVFANIGYLAGGFKALPAADVGDGQLDLCLIAPCPLRRFFRLFWLSRRGKHIRQPEVRIVQSPEFSVYSPKLFEIQADGQTLVDNQGRSEFHSAVFKIIPKALPLIC